MSCRNFFFTLVFGFLTSTGYASSEKIRYCPRVEQISMIYPIILAGYNDEGKYFRAGTLCEFCLDITVTPVKFMENESYYDDTSHTLACAYEIVSSYNDDGPSI